MNLFGIFGCCPKYRVPGGLVLCAQMGEVHTDSGKMLAIPDPREVQTVASATAEIDLVIRSVWAEILKRHEMLCCQIAELNQLMCPWHLTGVAFAIA